jgi:hypothetical protein
MPKLHVHTCDLYVCINRDRVFVYVRICVHGGVDEGRVNVEGDAGGDIPEETTRKGGDKPVKICTAMA